VNIKEYLRRNKMLITKEIEIDMGHRVPNHKSKCRNFHGHRYKIEVGVDDKVISTPGSSDEGMVIDFSDLKQIMMEELDGKFDHGFTMWEGDDFASDFMDIAERSEMKIIFVNFIPTAENLSRHWYTLIKPRLREKGISINHVKVWETPTSTALYTKDDDRRWKPDNQKTLKDI
jgi:6-pyruvoyltetrahydropterin/6-carboxytetrahydropterin synthase